MKKTERLIAAWERLVDFQSSMKMEMLGMKQFLAVFKKTDELEAAIDLSLA